MKRLIISLAIVLALVLALAAPVFATDPTGTHSQNWKLDSETGLTLSTGFSPSDMISPAYIMQISVLDSNQTGFVSIPFNNSVIWLADKPAATDVTFPWGKWYIDLIVDIDFAEQLDSDSLVSGIPKYVQMGDYDPGNGKFTPFKMKKLLVDTDTIPNIIGTMQTAYIETEAESATVFVEHYLAIRILNNSTSSATVYTGKQTNGDNLPSCVSSPQTDPGYPLPEIAAGVLLGAGLLGVGGFVLLRRRNSASKI
jgi:MYXO-CTERM domain-containing protein